MPVKNMAEYMKKRRAKRRAELVSMLGGKCAKCNFTQDLEFDHIDASSKLFHISGKELDKPMAILIAEVNKCQLLCYVHHREKTIKSGETGGGHNKKDKS